MKMGTFLLLEEQHENFVAAVTKWEIVAATNQMQDENERQWKKVNENTYDVSSMKSVSKKFLEVSLCSRAKQWQRNVQKNCEVAFLLIRPIIVVFYRSPALPSPLSITWFYILFEPNYKYYLALANTIY